MHQDASSTATASPSTDNQGPAEQSQETGQAGESRVDRAKLERTAQLALEELARREREECFRAWKVSSMLS